MRKSHMAVAVVVLVCSSLCRCDLASHPALQDLMGSLNSDQVNSLKQVLGVLPAVSSVLPLTNSLPLGLANNVLDILSDKRATADPAVNELVSNIASAGVPQQAAEQVAATPNAAAQSQQVAEKIVAASNAAAQSQAEQLTASEAASAAQAATSPAVTECGLSLPSGIIPELPLPILSYLLPSMSTLPPHILAQLPTSILSQLSPELLEKLPLPTLSELPVDALCKLSVPTLSGLPASALTKLPHSFISQMPADALDKLPTTFLAELPHSVLSGLPQSLLSRMVQDILGQLPLPLPILYQLTNLKQLATPDAISNLLSIIDIFKTISGLDPEMS